MQIDEAERLKALHERDILDSPPEERFDRVTRLARRLFGVDTALVNLIDADRQWTKSIAGADSMPDLARPDSFCAVAIGDAGGLIVEDTYESEQWRENPLVTTDPAMRFYAGMPISAGAGHRVGTLCLADPQPRRLDPADVALLRDLAKWVEQELNIDSELHRASEVQEALLPSAPPEDSRWSVAGFCRSSNDIGGDFFDWYRAGDATVVVIADVMGKGMPAAIVAATARAALRAGVDGTSAGATLTTAAATLAEDLASTETFVTVFVVCLGDDGRIRYADAGHGHAAVLRADGFVERVRPGGFPIGLGLGDGYQDHELELRPGDVLLAHSDGVLELPRGPQDSADLVRGLGGAGDAPAALRRVEALVEGVSPTDDVTAVVITRAAGQQEGS